MAVLADDCLSLDLFSAVWAPLLRLEEAIVSRKYSRNEEQQETKDGAKKRSENNSGNRREFPRRRCPKSHARAKKCPENEPHNYSARRVAENSERSANKCAALPKNVRRTVPLVDGHEIIVAFSASGFTFSKKAGCRLDSFARREVPCMN